MDVNVRRCGTIPGNAAENPVPERPNKMRKGKEEDERSLNVLSVPNVQIAPLQAREIDWLASWKSWVEDAEGRVCLHANNTCKMAHR